ncbi:MAG: hypothetical protein WD690_08665 [Vicinamibacterales bacterium]
MRKVSLFLIVALAAAASFSTPALAQDKAAEVLANVRTALGAGKLETLKTFSLEAKTARNIGERQMTSEIEIFLELPDKYLRVDNVTAPVAASMTSGFNGDNVIRSAGNAMGAGPMVMMNGVAAGGGTMVMTRVAPGGGAGGMRGAGPGSDPPTPEQQAMMNASIIRSQRVDLSRLMLGWFGQAHPGLNVTYTYAGEAESPDGKAHIINIKAGGGFDVNLFVDQATSIPLMLTYQGAEPRVINRTTGRSGGDGAAGVPPPPPPPPPPGAGAVMGHAPGMHTPPPAGGQAQMTQEEMQKQLEEMRKTPPKMIEYRIYFTDWKEVDGIQFPHMLQRAVGGTTTEEWTISKVKVNPKIDAKKFS